MEAFSRVDLLFCSENITSDILQGCAVVTLTLVAFISLVWLREQILHGGGPEWLDNEIDVLAADPADIGPVLPGDEAGEEAVAEVDLPEANNNEANNNVEDLNLNNNHVHHNQQGQGHALQHPLPPVLEADPIPLEGNLPAEPDEPEIEPNANVAEAEEPLVPGLDNGPVDPNNLGEWNPMGWDQAAEELTWERLLGLDGSLVFLEHVFWVVSLNTLFILVFGEGTTT